MHRNYSVEFSSVLAVMANVIIRDYNRIIAISETGDGVVTIISFIVLVQ